MRDVRIKNIYGPEGYQPEDEDESKKKGGQDDMVAEVYKTEGKIIRDVILSMNEGSMKWLKGEFDSEKDR